MSNERNESGIRNEASCCHQSNFRKLGYFDFMLMLSQLCVKISLALSTDLINRLPTTFANLEAQPTWIAKNDRLRGKKRVRTPVKSPKHISVSKKGK